MNRIDKCSEKSMYITFTEIAFSLENFFFENYFSYEYKHKLDHFRCTFLSINLKYSILINIHCPSLSE